MVKFIALMKRREGMSFEDFKNYYKSNHSQLRAALPTSTVPVQPKSKCIKTERQFLMPMDHPIDNATAGREANRYDVVLEKWYETMEDLEEDMAFLSHKDVWPIYLEDENKLFDRRYSRCYVVEETVDR